LIDEAGYQGCFGHGLGHSVGLDIHENPCFNTRCETLLQSGMVLTVEPGIYLENKFGVRIEDMIVVTQKGYKNLTKSPDELIIL
jgi:Xaa-Pro aminopeptidase